MPLLDSSISNAKKLFDVNVFGLLAVTQQFTPLLVPVKGTVINISSVAGYAWVRWTSYSFIEYLWKKR